MRPLDQTGLYEDLLSRLTLNWQGLSDKPQETPELTLRRLWFFAAGEFKVLSDGSLPLLQEDGAAHLQDLVAARVRGTPLAYLIGRQPFLGLDLLASPDAMIPRVETEILARAAVAAVQSITLDPSRAKTRALDLCCGSGNVALAIAAGEKSCQVLGADLSPGAIRIAMRNAEHLGLSDRVKFIVSDLFAAFDPADPANHFDLITCNPPYIATAKVELLPDEIKAYEPRMAFDGGPFGVKIFTRLLRDAPRFAAPGAVLCFEVGLGQGPAIANLMKKDGRYGMPEFFNDTNGAVRAIKTEILAPREMLDVPVKEEE